MADQHGVPDAEPGQIPEPWSPNSGQIHGWHPTPPPEAPRPYLIPPQDLPPHFQSHSSARSRRRWTQAGGGAAAGAGVAAKAGLLTKLFLLFKAGAVLVKFKVLGSMLLSVLLYATIYGPWYGVGIVALLLVHEMGHFIVLRSFGVKVSAPMFVPFLGAYVKHEPTESVAHDAIAALAGPALGTFGALAALTLSNALDSPLLRVIAYFGFFLNLLNLVPVPFLDGGRVAGALHPALWIVGVAGALIFVVLHPRPILLLVVAFGVFQLFQRWRSGSWVDPGYHQIAPSTRTGIGVAYAAVAIFCLWGMNIAYIPR